MKAILEFNLPEDKEDFKVAANATSLYLALWHINEDLLKLREEKDDEMVEMIFNNFWIVLDEYGITLTEMT